MSLSLNIALLSGQSEVLRVRSDDTVNDLRLQIQKQLGVKVSSLVASDGRLLKLDFSKRILFVLQSLGAVAGS